MGNIAKLTEEQEREIADIIRKTDMPLSKLAVMYGISYMRLYQVQVKYDAFRNSRKTGKPKEAPAERPGFDEADFSRRWREATGRLKRYDEKVRKIKMLGETYTDRAGAKYKVWESVRDGKSGFGICFKSPGKETKWRPWSKTFYEKSVDAFAVLRDEAKRKGWWQV